MQRARVPLLSMACIGLVVAGLVLRLAQLRLERGFWLDEAWLAHALEAFDPAMPARALPHHQVAPLAFLYLTRGAVQTLGTAEWVHRLLPFVASCLLLLVWWPLFRRVLQPIALLFSLALIVLSSPLLHYAAEFKPYGVDACVTAVLLGLALRTLEPTRRDQVGDAALVVAGGLAPLLSFTAPFVLAACGLALAEAWLRTRDPRTLRVAACCAVMWGACYLALYAGYVSPQRGDPYLDAFWQRWFAPWRLWTTPVLNWYGEMTAAVFEYWFGSFCAGLAFILGILGSLQLLRRKRPLGIVVITVPVLTLAASLAGVYPLKDRLLLFVLPLVVIAVASGVQTVWDLAGRPARSLAFAIVATLLIPPGFAAWQASRYPLSRHDPRPLLATVVAQARPGDVLYVQWPLVPVVRWYTAQQPPDALDIRYGEEADALHLGESPAGRWPRYAGELAALEGHGRVWILLDQFINDARTDEAWFLGRLDAMGRRLHTQQGKRASLHLFDLRASTRPGSGGNGPAPE